MIHSMLGLATDKKLARERSIHFSNDTIAWRKYIPFVDYLN